MRSTRKVSSAHTHIRNAEDENDESDLLGVGYDFEHNATTFQDSVESPRTPKVLTSRDNDQSYRNNLAQGPILNLEEPLNQRTLQNLLGLTAITSPATPLIDIIFLHGLGGGSVTTWSWNHDSRKCWLGWLADEMELSSSRIWTFGYNAPVWGASSGSNINDLAKDFLLKMKYEALGTEPIGSVSPLNAA